MRVTERLVYEARYAGRWLLHLFFGAWPVLALIGLILICGGVALLFGANERSVRLTGLTLQVMGFLTTMINLIGIGTSFNAPSLWAGFRKYLHGFPRRNHRIEASGTVSSTMFGDAVVSVGRNPNATTAERLKRLESDADHLLQEVGQLRRDAKHNHRQLSDSIASNVKTLLDEIQKVRDLVHDAMTGSLALQWVGVFYFVIGIGLGTASPEVACWLGDTAVCR